VKISETKVRHRGLYRQRILENNSQKTKGLKKGNMQYEVQQNEITKPVRNRRPLSWKARLGILGMILLGAGGMGAVGLNQIMPRLPNRAQGFTDRLACYVHQGLLQADMRTFASAVGYIVSRDAEVPSAATPTNSAVARNATQSSPKS